LTQFDGVIGYRLIDSDSDSDSGSDSDNGSDFGSDSLVYTYISGQHDKVRKGGCSLLPVGSQRTQGVGASFRLEPENQGVVASFWLEPENSGSCSFLQVGACK
jgi:hypothetical protein